MRGSRSSSSGWTTRTSERRRPALMSALVASLAVIAAATPGAGQSQAAGSSSPSASTFVSTGMAVLGDILFTTKPNNCCDVISAIAADGSRPLRQIITHGWMPDLSPDGTKIAFTSDRAGDNMDIYLANADGSDVARVTGNDFNAFHPIVSPDGKQILFSAFPSQIYVVGIDGSGEKQLLADNGDMGSWSPDGKHIAYISGQDGTADVGNAEIYVMNADASGQTRITNDPASEGIPSWSPDGKQIAFTSDRGGSQDLYVMNADGTDVQQLTSDPGMDDWPAWSPDGHWIAFSRKADQDGMGDIWVIGADGTNPVNLTNSPTDEEYGPSWR